jgi:hypothetical protein
MERAMLRALLARAEQHIALGKEQINNQYRIIATRKQRSRYSGSSRVAETIH